MQHKLSVFLVLFISFYITCGYAVGRSLFISQTPANNQILGVVHIPLNVMVSASIGSYHFTLFGYASPAALVTIEGMGIFDQTYSRSDGYFEFENRFSPFSSREACLTAQDQFGRISNPTCIPPFTTSKDVTIGPVLLPPTISLDKSDYFMGDEIIVTGQTIPNSDLQVSTFIDEKRSVFNYLAQRLKIVLIRPVEALTFPLLQTKADEKGNFSLSLPSSNPDFFRVFLQTTYDKSLSPRSITLSLKVLPIWMILIKLFGILFVLIKSRLIEITIIAQAVFLLIYFIRLFFHPFILARQRAIVLREKYALMKSMPHEIIQISI